MWKCSTTRIPEGGGRWFPGHASSPLLAAPELVPPIGSFSPISPRARARQRQEPEGVAGYAASPFAGGGEASRRAADLARRVAERLANTVPVVQGVRRLAARGALIDQDFAESRLRAFGSRTRRFIHFCELDGYEWESASRHAMESWLTCLYETTGTSGQTAEQYSEHCQPVQ
jgi:hypothetical protein